MVGWVKEGGSLAGNESSSSRSSGFSCSLCVSFFVFAAFSLVVDLLVSASISTRSTTASCITGESILIYSWMEKLYREKGGAAQSFNCVRMVLAAPDLDRLEVDIKESRLPDTESFFFGDSYHRH